MTIESDCLKLSTKDVINIIYGDAWRQDIREGHMTPQYKEKRSNKDDMQQPQRPMKRAKPNIGETTSGKRKRNQETEQSEVQGIEKSASGEDDMQQPAAPKKSRMKGRQR